jgi:outer membrane protein W
MQKFISCLILLCTIFFTTLAQQSFEPGYVLKHNQDTVKGYIETGLEYELTQSVKFKADVNASVKEFGTSELTGFGIGKSVYQNIEFLNTINKMRMNAFAKQLVTGEYDLFSYATADRKFYLLRKDTTDYFIYDRVTRANGEIDQEGNYLNILHFISVSCNKIAGIYDRVGYNDKDMTAFILKVDNCLSSGKATSFYEKPKIQMQPFIFIGGFPVSGMNQFTANFTLRFVTPQIDKKSSLNIGLLYSNTLVETDERSDYYVLYTMATHNQVYSIPVTFQYNFTSGIVQPYFYAGISGAYSTKTANSYTTGIPSSSNQFGVALVLGIGIEAKIVSKIYIKADWRYEVLMQYPAIGVAYRF